MVKDPGGQGRLGPERAERLDDADKGLLEQVLGDMALADERWRMKLTRGFSTRSTSSR